MLPRSLFKNIALLSLGCAWVLWAHVSTEFKNSTITDTDYWEARKTADTLEACQLLQRRAAKEEALELQNAGYDVSLGREDALVSIIAIAKRVTTAILFECWPETMDPRK